MADKVGYIYLATNETMPGLVKIGMTTGDVKERLKQLSAETGVPKPFKCPFSREVKNPSDVEKHLHELFGWCRVNDKREFFETDFRNVKNALLTMGMDNATTFPDIPKEESNISDEDVNSLALIEAVKKSDNLSEVERLLDAGADPNMVNEKGETALTESILPNEHGSSFDRATKQLLWAGAKPNLKGKNGKTALFQAVAYGKSDLVKVLLNAGANVNAQNSSGETPLFCTGRDYDSYDSLRGDERKNVLKILLGAGADVNLAKENGETPLHAFTNIGYDAVLELFNAGANVNATDKNNNTPLHIAVAKLFRIVESLLKNGAKTNAIDKDGNTPLHLASKTNIVKLLLKNGAKINSTNYKEETPLYIAAYEGGCDVVELLLAAGENPNLCDNKYRSPLDIAQFFNHNEIAELLTKHGGMSGKDLLELKILEEEVEQTYSNSSILRRLIENGDTARVRKLLEAGASVLEYTDSGEPDYSPPPYTRYIHQAAREGQVEIMRLILGYSSRVSGEYMSMEELIEREDECGDTPLFCAASEDFDEKNDENRRNNAETVELLIQYGADVNAQQQPDRYNDGRVSVLDVAKSDGNAKIVELLKKHGAKTSAELHAEAET